MQLSVRTLLEKGARLLDEASYSELHSKKRRGEELAAVVYLNNGTRVLVRIQEDLRPLPGGAERRQIVALPVEVAKEFRKK